MNDPTARLTPEYRWKTLLDEFKRDFPAFDLRLKIMERDEFAAALQSPAGNSPDVAFVDNATVRDPLTNAGAALLMVGESRFAYNGWWTISRNTKNLATAKAFLLWLSRSPSWKPPHVNTNAIGPADIASVQSVSKDALERLESGDTKALSLLLDPDAGHLDFRSLQTGTPASIDPFMIFENPRLAFALVSEVVEGDKTLWPDPFCHGAQKTGRSMEGTPDQARTSPWAGNSSSMLRRLRPQRRRARDRAQRSPSEPDEPCAIGPLPARRTGMGGCRSGPRRVCS